MKSAGVKHTGGAASFFTLPITPLPADSQVILDNETGLWKTSLINWNNCSERGWYLCRLTINFWVVEIWPMPFNNTENGVIIIVEDVNCANYERFFPDLIDHNMDDA